MESNKALTITLITIACLVTVLALLWILRGWIMKLWDRMCECLGRREGLEKVKDLEVIKVIEIPQSNLKEKVGEETIYAIAKEREPPCVPAVDAPKYIPYYEMPDYVPLKMQFERMDEEAEKRRRERVNREMKRYVKNMSLKTKLFYEELGTECLILSNNCQTGKLKSKLIRSRTEKEETLVQKIRRHKPHFLLR